MGEDLMSRLYIYNKHILNEIALNFSNIISWFLLLLKSWFLVKNLQNSKIWVWHHKISVTNIW